jgi:cell division protein FtsB
MRENSLSEHRVTKANNYNALKNKVSSLVKSFNKLKARNMELEDKVSKYEKEKRKAKKDIEKIITKVEELEVG